MQHHRFTNHKTKDPDIYVATGPRWLLPFKWLSLDLNYLYFYLRPSVFLQRPKSERMELYGAIALAPRYLPLSLWAVGALPLVVFDTFAIYLIVSRSFFRLSAPLSASRPSGRSAVSMHIESSGYGVVDDALC